MERGESKPLNILMDDDPETMEYLDFDKFDIRQERFVALEDISPRYGEAQYEYDFGGSWEHAITLEKVVKSNVFQVTYVEGSGERPPEEIGGGWGYEEYMRIMADEEHPEYENMEVWAENQKERTLSPKKINHRLKQAISGYGYSFI